MSAGVSSGLLERLAGGRHRGRAPGGAAEKLGRRAGARGRTPPGRDSPPLRTAAARPCPAAGPNRSPARPARSSASRPRRACPACPTARRRRRSALRVVSRMSPAAPSRTIAPSGAEMSSMRPTVYQADGSSYCAEVAAAVSCTSGRNIVWVGKFVPRRVERGRERDDAAAARRGAPPSPRAPSSNRASTRSVGGRRQRPVLEEADVGEVAVARILEVVEDRMAVVEVARACRRRVPSAIDRRAERARQQRPCRRSTGCARRGRRTVRRPARRTASARRVGLRRERRGVVQHDDRPPFEARRRHARDRHDVRP